MSVGSSQNLTAIRYTNFLIIITSNTGAKQDTDRQEGVYEKYHLHINCGQSDI